MLVVAIVAILFVGPKELPGMLRTFGKSVKKIRALAGDFQQQFDQAVKDAELDGVKNTIDEVRSLDPTKSIKDKLNPLKSDLEDVKKSVESKTEFNAESLFDESKAPEIEEPVKVDVDAALERQKKIDEEFAKIAPSSGANAVPGFGGPAAKAVASEPKSSADAVNSSEPKSSTDSTSAKTTKSRATNSPARGTKPNRSKTGSTAKAKVTKAPTGKAPAKTKNVAKNSKTKTTKKATT